MPMGHLMLGLLSGLTASVLALVAGLPLWAAGLIYVVAGNIGVVVSVLLQLLADNARRPPPRRARRPRKAARIGHLRPLH